MEGHERDTDRRAQLVELDGSLEWYAEDVQPDAGLGDWQHGQRVQHETQVSEADGDRPVVAVSETVLPVLDDRVGEESQQHRPRRHEQDFSDTRTGDFVPEYVHPEQVLDPPVQDEFTNCTSADKLGVHYCE